MAAMLGWLSDASTCASRSKRAMRSRVLGEGRGQDLDGDVAIELGVGGAIDRAHAALAERRDDFVGAEFDRLPKAACGIQLV